MIIYKIRRYHMKKQNMLKTLLFTTLLTLGLTNIEIPNSVTTIGDNAFGGTYLKEVSFPAGSALNFVGNEAFKSCRQLKKVDFYIYV